MARSTEAVAAKYDAIRERVDGGEQLDVAIEAEIPNSDRALSTLRAAYFRVGREKGHTGTRAVAAPPDIEAFRARFEAAVAAREAEQRSGFAILVEQIGERLREVAGKHPPSWVRQTIESCGVTVSAAEFKAWLKDVAISASPRKGPRSRKAAAVGSPPPVTTSTDPDPDVGSAAEVPAQAPAMEEPLAEPAPALAAKPPRPAVRGKQIR